MLSLLALLAIAAPSTDWNAIVNRQPVVPPGGPFLVVRGKMTFNTTGYKAKLQPAEPQGFNPKILLLEVKITPPPADAPTLQELTTIPVSYRTKNKYDSVTVIVGKKRINLKIQYVD